MKRLLAKLIPGTRKGHEQSSQIEALRFNVDANWYLETYPDVKEAGLDPASHFLSSGIWEGRLPNRFFDPAWYVRHYPQAAGNLPILYYAKVGRHKRHNPGPQFSAIGYLEAHPDVAASGFDPLDHYIRHGQHEGRSIVAASTADAEDSGKAKPAAKSYAPEFLETGPFETETLARVNEAFSPTIERPSGPEPAPAPPPPAAPAPTDPALRGSPFWFYNCLLNAEGTILRYARNDLVPHPEYLTNFIGVKVAPRYLHGVIDGREGQIEAPPLPSSWHADLTEWTAALRAVDLAGSHFKMAELGCGWGCWMNMSGMAARQTGRTAFLIGVEGDEDHIAYAHDALALNGFRKDQYVLHRGIAAAESGVALFPRQETPGKEYGSEPIFGVSKERAAAAVAAGTHDVLDMIPLSVLLADGPADGQPLDLLHIDIQGGEANFVSRCIDELTENVAYLVIGTHSRQIEGRLFEVLIAHDWVLEIERPGYLDLDVTLGPTIKIDGAQGWRNTKLRPD